MRIKKSITKGVEDARENLRRELIEATIALMKQIGADRGSVVKFSGTVILTQTVIMGDDTEVKSNIKTRTMLADEIAYNDAEREKENTPYYVLRYNGHWCASSPYLDLAELLTVYEAMRQVVREE